MPGKLEKVIEENGGHMYYDTTVKKVLFKKGISSTKSAKPTVSGVILEDDNNIKQTVDIYNIFSYIS